MASIKMSAENIAKYRSAIEFIKEKTFNTSPVQLQVTAVCTKFRIRPEFIKILVKRSIIKAHEQGKGRIKFYSWIYGARPIDDKLTKSIISSILDVIRQYDAKPKTVKEFKVQEKAEQNIREKSNITKHVGTLFTLKQLETMGEFPISAGTDVFIKTSFGEVVFNKVDEICFIVDNSSLNILINKCSKVDARDSATHEIKLNNVALAFSKRGANSTAKGLLIEVVEGPNIKIKEN